MNKELIKQIETKMKEREYWLGATSGDNTILYYNDNIDKEKPHINLEVFINQDDSVEFKFKYLTKRAVMLSTDKIGSFFDDEHFNKFENDFWNLATQLYNYENN